MSEVKKATECPDKGYRQLKIKLLQGLTPSCEACKQLLKERGFQPEKLQELAEGNMPGQPPEEVEEKPHEAAAEQQDDADADDQPQEPTDPFEYAKSLAPIITLLEPGDCGRKLPYQCSICKTAGYPNGKIGDLVRPASIKHFLKNHINSNCHQRALQRQRVAESNLVDCGGLRVGLPAQGGWLFEMKREFHQWASMTNIERFAKHSYSHDANGAGWTIKHFQCARQCRLDPTRGAICDQCQILSKANQVVRTVHKFGLKYWLARLLNAKIFHTPEVQKEVEDEFKVSGTWKYDPKRAEVFLNLKVWQLQQVVRQSWSSHTKESSTSAYKDFVESVVNPALHVNPQSLPDSFSTVLAKWSACLASGQVPDSDAANLRLASAHLGGAFNASPLLQGISLQCLRKLDKEARNIQTMRGRKCKESSAEASLVEDAGLTLAMACCNKALARQLLGRSWHNIG